MDLIRTYCEIAFARVAERWLCHREDNTWPLADMGKFILSEESFLDETRIHHPEISDDSIRLIYRLGLDDWCRFEYYDDTQEKGNIMRALAFLAKMMLDEINGEPTVRFRNLFRWREITQLLGEDLLTCAFLAYEDKETEKERRFDWPSVAHNDNPDLNFLFRTKKLCELHSHLKASTNVFEVSWVSLMNHIGGKDKAFAMLNRKHEPSQNRLGEKIYGFIRTAARLRWEMYSQIIKEGHSSNFMVDLEEPSITALDSTIALERQSFSKSHIPDYIVESPNSPMSVYAGERYLIYCVLKRIYAENDETLTEAFYRYVLTKNLLRKYIVQTNNNIGFSNFQRYQDIKTVFLDKDYRYLPTALPLWEAKHHNYTKIFESRIVPITSKKSFLREVMTLNKFNMERDSLDEVNERSVLANKDWLFIFHFLKRRSNKNNALVRDFSVRKANKINSIPLAEVSKLMESEGVDRGMDAASSEFACRPEVFSQTFRFLRHYGFDATFHAGEDFYDLADGLRAIDESIVLLNLRTGDRIGHALALGINSEEYYRTRHNTTALPKQWMLDNVVWLLMKSKILSIEMDSQTEWFLSETYKQLTAEIGYRIISNEDRANIPDMHDYWESMALRGDNPEMYDSEGEIKNNFSPFPDDWEYYSLLDSEGTNRIRNNNPIARQLYRLYHTSVEIRNKGEKVRVFKLPSGYQKLIGGLQEGMIKDISKRQLCIECCPSSNIRIGRLDKFENHPIFRFAPINPSDTRYPLSVTVNTDDLGVFSTSLPNEYSLLALALLKKKDRAGNHIYSKREVYDWISRLIDNGYKYTFLKIQSDSEY